MIEYFGIRFSLVCFYFFEVGVFELFEVFLFLFFIEFLDVFLCMWGIVLLLDMFFVFVFCFRFLLILLCLVLELFLLFLIWVEYIFLGFFEGCRRCFCLFEIIYILWLFWCFGFERMGVWVSIIFFVFFIIVDEDYGFFVVL